MTATMHEQKAFVWESRYDTGIEAIDDQHHVLVGTLNEANLTLKHETSALAIDQLLQDLLAYALYHFETEETMMLEHDYAVHDAAEAQRHIDEHRAFAQRVVAWRSTLETTGDLDRDALLGFLNRWLREHILGIDQKLAAFLRARGACA